MSQANHANEHTIGKQAKLDKAMFRSERDPFTGMRPWNFDRICHLLKVVSREVEASADVEWSRSRQRREEGGVVLNEPQLPVDAALDDVLLAHNALQHSAFRMIFVKSLEVDPTFRSRSFGSVTDLD